MIRPRAPVLIWLLMSVAIAEARPFIEIVVGADYVSGGAALLSALAGGLTRTCFMLARSSVIVRSEMKQAARDTVYALIAGGLVYLAMLVFIAVSKHDLEDVVQAAIVFGAGFLRNDFLSWGERYTNRIGDALITGSVVAIGRILGGPAAAAAPPARPAEKDTPS